ncbi:MAG: helix-turn-helix transcriptional regulator [Planctomycetes bacterium]|nr:helix-turn-helix transcriptional regulator [Planctomycetota bacterium]
MTYSALALPARQWSTDLSDSLPGLYNRGMAASDDNDAPALAEKIARLVEERGWNQDEFARIADLHRLTVRQILLRNPRRLHNATVAACARALGLSVSDLRLLPIDVLLPRMQPAEPTTPRNPLHRLFEEAAQPELMAWLQRNPDRARLLAADEIDELLSLQGTGGPMTAYGVERFVELIERKRRLKEQVDAIAGTEYLEILEKLIGLLYQKIQPYPDKT